ncbi:MAG: N-acetylmuramic acid 6-phosphate etherase [Candidatus Zixiibacteriota bacterium]
MTDMDALIRQLKQLDTEKVNPDTIDIDRLSPFEIARKINAEDKKVAAVVESALDSLAKAAEMYAQTLRSGGRVFYVGAGTSGRLGVLDAAECPPTFGTDPNQIIGVISGGYETLVLSKEGVEDNRDAASGDLQKQKLTQHDFVIGIAASRRTPYTLAALEYARSVGCKTAFIICNRAADLEVKPDVLIELPVGPEAVTGSTRMKSGTAQKMALNIISTTAMVLLGKTYGNLMIDLQARSEKLAARSRKILMELSSITLADAEELLRRSGGSVKLAIAMHWLRCDRDEAERRLQQVGGFLTRLDRV